jgi:hypothetical protein
MIGLVAGIEGVSPREGSCRVREQMGKGRVPLFSMAPMLKSFTATMFMLARSYSSPYLSSSHYTHHAWCSSGCLEARPRNWWVEEEAPSSLCEERPWRDRPCRRFPPQCKYAESPVGQQTMSGNRPPDIRSDIWWSYLSLGGRGGVCLLEIVQLASDECEEVGGLWVRVYSTPVQGG